MLKRGANPAPPPDVDPELAVLLAQARTCFGPVGADPDAVAWVAAHYLGRPVPDDAFQYGFDYGLSGEQLDDLLGALDALDSHALLGAPRPETTRINHSVGLGSGSHHAVALALESILSGGLRATKTAMQHHYLVFAVVDTPDVDVDERVYAHRLAYVTVDLPWDWPGWDTLDAPGDPFLGPPRPGSVVTFDTPIPPEFIVGVNGLPVGLYPPYPPC